MSTTENQLIDLVEGYFSTVDSGRVQDVLDYLAPNAVFRLATFDKIFVGRDTEIKQMFQRLYDRYRSVWHGNFSHIVGKNNQIASQFTVINETHSLIKQQKYNANFFTVSENKFSEIVVYMSGENSLA